MGGFTNVLGHAAAGFEQARQIDQQRQFEDAQARRKQHIDILGKIAADESLDPTLRNWALQEGLNGAQTPYDKKWEPFKNMPSPPSGGGRQIQQPTQSFTPAPMPQPPAAMGVTGPPIPQLPSTAQFTPPAQPEYEGHIKSHAAQVEEAVQAAQAMAGTQMGGQVFQQQPGGGYATVPVSKAGTAMPAIPNTVSPYAMAGRNLEAKQYIDPTDQSGQRVLWGSYDKINRAMYGQDGQIVPNAQVFEPSLVTKGGTTTESMSASGAITRTHVSGPVKPGQGGAIKSGTKSPGAAHITSETSTSWQNDDSPVAMAAKRWATQGQAPKGGPMAERQVLSYMKQHNMEPALPVPPSLQQKIQESFVARNSAIDIIDDILKNSKVLDSLVSSGKIQIAIDPSTKAGIVTRAAGLTDQEAKVAQDYQQLVEHANLLRGPLGATGFRSEEAWEALQAQRGNLLSDPRITRGVLAGMRDRLIKLNNADKMVLSGQGMNTSTLPTPPQPTVGAHSVGDVIKLKSGKQIKITAIHPDGSFDGSEVK